MERMKTGRVSWWTLYQNFVRGVVLPLRQDDLKKLSYWRNEAFCNIITYITPLSLIALIPSIYMAFMNGVPIVGCADILAFALVILITTSRGLRLETRKLIFILMLYCLSVILLYYLSLPGPGLLFSLAVTIFSCLIYSSSAAYYSAWTNTLICIAFALLIYFKADIPIAAAYNTGTWIAISSNLILLSFACTKCLDLLLAGLTASLDDNHVAERKLEKANRLYQFTSHINQSIVHTKDEETLFRKSCDIAFTIGGFKMAWIGKFDSDLKTTCLIDQNGIPEKSIPLFSAPYANNGPQDYVLRTGEYYVCNDIENELELEIWKTFAANNGIGSCIILPIRRDGNIIGSFNIYAVEINFFDEAEIGLLKEATGDISFALDVFEKEKRHQLAEERIIKNETRFRSLIEKSTDVKTLTTKNGDFIYGSPSVTKLFGYTVDEFLNKSAFTFFHPDDLPDLIENRGRILEFPGRSFSFEYRVLHKNGTWIWCEGTLTNMLHEPGILAFVSNIRDITERKQAEQERAVISDNLQKALSDLQKNMDSSRDIICSIDEEGKFANVSKAAESMLGYQANELLGKRYIDMVVAEDVEKTNKIAIEITGGKPAAFFENRYMHKNGSIVHMLWSATWNADSKLMYCIAKDVTERKKAEEEKEKMSVDLMQRSKNLEQFSYIISHNLRAPVANILGYAELMKYENPSRDHIEASMKGMAIAAQKLDEVIRDLNQILHVRTIVSENKEEVYFENLIEDISLSIDNIIKEENVVIRTDFKSIDKMLSVRGYLHSVLYNLTLNSIKFHKPGVRPLIEIKSMLTAKGIQLLFKDNGLGIDLAQHGESVFGLYKRFHSHIEGRGMGLFMTKTQVETLGGKITVISEVNKGTEFTIEFENIPI